jgi:hypothetical protein
MANSALQPFLPHRPFLQDFESLGKYHDFWTAVIFKAPDNFHFSFLKEPIDQRQALLDSFESLRRGFVFVRTKVKDDRLLRTLEELLRMSHEFYSAGDRKQGIRALQEGEGLIWPSHRIRLELVAEAQRRAFGAVQVFRDVKPRRFDGEGSVDSLGPGQRALFDSAQSRAMDTIRLRQERSLPRFKPNSSCLALWFMTLKNTDSRTSRHVHLLRTSSWRSSVSSSMTQPSFSWEKAMPNPSLQP